MVAYDGEEIGRGHKGIFWIDGNVLYLDLVVGYTSAYICPKSPNGTVHLRSMHFTYKNFTSIIKKLKY